MPSYESDYTRLLKEIQDKLDHYEQKITDRNAKIIIKYENTKNIDDYSKTLVKQCNLLKASAVLKEKHSILVSQLDKLQNKSKQNNKTTDKVKQEKEKIDKKIESERKKAKELDQMSSKYGFQLELKQEDVYTVHFTKLPIDDPEIKFTFEILDTNDKIKVLTCEPASCIDTAELENQLENEDEVNRKFMKLILMIRQQIIKKYRS